MVHNRYPSPSQSTTSVSDNEDDDMNKSTFFPGADSLVVAPAQWSTRVRRLPESPKRGTSQSPMSTLPPEILIQILRHLHTPRDLYHSLLVSRSWCECSVELLWHRPGFTRLSTLVKMMRVLSRGDQTFTYARFIRRLNFFFLGADLTDSLFSRLAQCDRLERLTLVNCGSISDDALARVLPCLHNLVAIDLTGVGETSDKVIVGLASAAKRLQGINLGGCKRVTDQGVFALAVNCPSLRRVKLSGVDQITDESISALAKSCPLLLEIDLNNCKRITDVSVRDLWMYSTHMREMRLSQCSELTDAAFPAPPKPESNSNAQTRVLAPLARHIEQLPPLIINRSFDHLRMLDLTACSLITDDAIDGIISHAPKIRNMVLSKCTGLTDRSVENICKLGKHLHYLHLGHAANITDRSIKSLARCCTRLRYVDFANCVLLTDMSVFELSSLPKLRRIGLVRVNNLTDEAIYALAERHSTLERIHLSYCDQISVMAIHFLLQKLHKLTHLSLTGIPSFRKQELQQFCRQPPQEFNMSQRQAFCVYSGSGVARLRDFLTDLFHTITDDMNPEDDETEYDDDYDDLYAGEDTPDAEMETGNEGDDDDDYPRGRIPANHSRTELPRYRGHRPTELVVNHHPHHPELAIQRDQTIRPSQPTPTIAPPPLSLPLAPIDTSSQANTLPVPGPSNIASQRKGRGFGQQLFIEGSTSPTPSDVASNRSSITNQSNGAGFFRTYNEPPSTSRSNGALTPDYVYAEIGHGRGSVQSSGHMTLNSLSQGFARHGLSSVPSFDVVPSASSQGITQVMQSVNPSPNLTAISNGRGHERELSLPVPSHSESPRSDGRISWPHVEQESVPLPSSAPPALVEPSSASSPSGAEPDTSRGRKAKRSLRNTLNAAEHYATSFLFGRASASASTSNSHTPEVNRVNGASGVSGVNGGNRWSSGSAAASQTR